MRVNKWGGKYIPGSNWVICDHCGFKTRASEARYNHDGLLVCLKDWEPQHPQEYLVESRAEKIVPDKVRSEPTAVDVSPSETWGDNDTPVDRSSNQITVDDL